MTDPERNRFIARIASEYGKRLRRFLSLRLRNPADVPDLAQEVFLRLLRVDHHDAIRSPEAYLFTVASHVVHQHTLRQNSIPAMVDIDEVFAEIQTSTDEPLRQADTRQRIETLKAALAELPPSSAAALMLHRFAGHSIEEIGKALGVARPTAKKYIARALLHCRERHKGGE